MGLDLSTSETGWSLLYFDGDTFQIQYGTIKTNRKFTDFQKQDYIIQSVFEIIRDFNPAIICIEDTFCNARNFKTSKKLIALGGIVRYSLDTCGITYIDVPPTTLKKYLTDKGNASKQMMKDEVSKTLGIEIKNDNVADAIALAFYAGKQLFDANRLMMKMEGFIDDKKDTNP